MGTPENVDQNWFVSQSVEDWRSPCGPHTAPSVTDERWSPYTIPPTPALYMDSQGHPRWSRSQSVLSQRSYPQQLSFLPLEEWNSSTTNDEVPPCYIRYSIEWRAIIKKKVILKDTEQDVVLSPALYWETCMQARLEERLRKKGFPPQAIRVEQIEVVVSVTGRTGRPLTRSFDDLPIDWSFVEKKLTEWSDLFHKGKVLSVNICLRYTEIQSATALTGPSTKITKARRTATSRQLDELTAQVDAEETTTGQPSAWRHVYNLMRCPGPPCVHEPWCWYDSSRRRRFKMLSHHLRALVDHVHDRQPLESHDDIPDVLRQQIYAEEEQRMRKKRVNSAAAPSERHPIQITNVLPVHPQTESEAAQKPAAKRLDITGLHDVNVQDYCNWLQSRVQDESQKAEYQKAADFLRRKAFDLDLLYEDQDPSFLVEQGEVEVAIARRFVKDIPLWAELCKENGNLEI